MDPKKREGPAGAADAEPGPTSHPLAATVALPAPLRQLVLNHGGEPRWGDGIDWWGPEVAIPRQNPVAIRIAATGEITLIQQDNDADDDPAIFLTLDSAERLALRLLEVVEARRREVAG